ncbi:MAG: HD domain-containing protein [Clostridia bacterium]|nr:HD domain-containing protein [Clostridia bacterium]
MNGFLNFFKSTNYILSFDLAAIVVYVTLLCIVLFNSKYRTTSVKWFRLLIISLLASTVLDVFTAFTFSRADTVAPALNMLLNILSQVGLLLSTLVAALYLRASLRTKRDVWTLLEIVAIGGYLIASAVNLFVPFLYSFWGGQYVKLEGFPVFYIVLFLLILDMLVLSFRQWKNFQTVTQRVGYLSIVGLLTASILLVYLVVPSVLFVLFAASICCLIALFTQETPDFAALREKNNQLEAEVQARTKEVGIARRRAEITSIETAEALVRAIDALDPYTNGHSIRVAQYSRMIGERAGMDEREIAELFYAALLHDVGKIGISREILRKGEGLTDNEWREIRKHPVIGSDILRGIRSMPNVASGARWHHERYDGKGYPDHRAGEAIPPIARIICVADCYDAITSRRSYRDPMSQAEARAEIERGRGKLFDPYYANIMLEIIDEDKNYELCEGGKKKNAQEPKKSES